MVNAGRGLRALLALGSIVVASIGIAAAPANAAPVPDPDVRIGRAHLELTRVARLEAPVMSVSPPGLEYRGTQLVAEQGGTVRVVKGGHVLRRPFADLSSMVATGQAEQGLLSIALSPDFRSDRRLYLHFTGLDDSIRVIAMQVRKRNPFRVNRASFEDVITIQHDYFPNHNGGTMRFDGDGAMWLSVGDGGALCDHDEFAQDTDLLLGKLLRIVPDPVAGGYAIPADNPFVGGPGRDEIYAYGFRNPFRFTLDERTGSIAIGDVGQSAIEEVDIETLADARGANFGWDALEGTRVSDPAVDCHYEDEPTPIPPGAIPPVLEYPHTNSRCAVTGGMIVRGDRLPTLRGRYVFADYCHRGLYSFVWKGDQAKRLREIKLGSRYVTSIEPDRRGRLILTSSDGRLMRVDDARHGHQRSR